MIRFEGIRRLFRLVTRRVDVERDVDQELRFHFDACVSDLVAGGLSREEAQREARRRFGDVERYRRSMERLDRARYRRHRVARWFDIVRQDVGYTLRGMRRSPGFTIGVATTVALGVGANTTMFGVIDRILLTPPPHIVKPSEIKRLYVQRVFLSRTYISASLTYPDVQDWVNSEVFAGVGTFAPRQLTLGRGTAAAQVRATFASASFFTVLGARPAFGRNMLPEDDVVGAEGVALLGYEFWQRHFDGDEEVLGRVLSVGPSTVTVVGVLPKGFSGVDLAPVDVWLPLHQLTSIARGQTSRGSYFLNAVVRVRDENRVIAAGAEATRVHRLARLDNASYDPEATVILAPLQAANGPRATDESQVARWLGAVAAIVLVIACANVANLLLARGTAKRREIAVRLSLGAGRARLVAQLLIESVVFAGMGGLGALAVAHWGTQLVGSLILPGAGWTDVVANPRVLAFTAIASVLTGLVAGVVPAIQSSRAVVTEALKESARGGSLRRSQMRSGFLVAQASLAVVLLVGAGLFVRSLSAIRAVDLGFDLEGVALVMLETAPGEPLEPIERAYERAIERIELLPGVLSAGLTSAAPFRNSVSERLRVPGRDSIPRLPSGGPYFYAVSSGFLSTLDLQIAHGRGIQSRDVAGAPPVAVVNQSMARHIWPGEDPIGQCLLIGRGDPDCTQVIGVVEDSRRQLVLEEVELMYYLSRDQRVVQERTRGLVVRAALPMETMVPMLRQEIFSAAPNLRFVAVLPYEEIINPQYAAWRLGATMFSLFGVLAVVVAAVGLYAVLAFEIAQRAHEFGVRSALGAAPRRLVRMVVQHSVGLTMTGVAVGVSIAWLTARFVEPLLYATSPHDPSVFTVVAATLLFVALAASVVPALRATRVDPAAALRTE